MKNSHFRETDSQNTEIQNYKNQTNILEGTSPQTDLLKQKLAENKIKDDSLAKIINELEDHIQKDLGLIDELVNKNILDALDNDLTVTRGKVHIKYKIPDVQYKRLKRAVFFNMLSFHADGNILWSSLQALQKENPDFKESDMKRIQSGYKNLMIVRLRWLKEVAIPALQHDIDSLAKHPRFKEMLMQPFSSPLK